MKIASSLLTPAVIILANLGIAAAPIANADSDDDFLLQVLEDKGISFPKLTGPGVRHRAKTSRMCRARPTRARGHGHLYRCGNGFVLPSIRQQDFLGAVRRIATRPAVFAAAGGSEHSTKGATAGPDGGLPGQQPGVGVKIGRDQRKPPAGARARAPVVLTFAEKIRLLLMLLSGGKVVVPDKE
jgi:hypothetical protein